MKRYWLYLKSHSDAPDYEDWAEAPNKEAAVEVFYDHLKQYGWDKYTIRRNTEEELV